MTEMYGYSKKVIEIFRHPKNMGEIKNPDGIGRVGNPVCGDVMVMYLKITKDKAGKEIIKDVKVKTFGCIAAISTSSILTEMIKGKSIEEALKISNMDIASKLDGLPPIKMHCSVLSADALKEAVYDYYRRKGRKIPKGLRLAHERSEKVRKSIRHIH
jgi:nitrogen fixation NifU-like protein